MFNQKKKNNEKNSSRARQMLEIMKNGEPKKEEIKEKKTPILRKPKFRLKGLLYRRFHKEELKPQGSRTRQLLQAMTNQSRASKKYPKFELVTKKKFITLLPHKELKNKEMLYPLIEPYSYANVKWDHETDVLTYNIIEPELNEFEKHVLEKVKEGLIQIINISLDDVQRKETMLDFLEENVQRIISDYGLEIGDEEYLKIMYYIFRDFIGLNKIEPLLRDPYIEDIGLDGLNIPVYVVHQRYGSIKTNINYSEIQELREFVTKLAERCDRYISYAEPLLDGALADGTRVQASLAGDVTTKGPTFSIRKFREVPFTPVDIIHLNTASSEMLAYLWFVVENSANILITGGVATGKTSFLNTLSLFIPPEAKIVSIEDTRELSLPHENWIPGVSRMSFTGTGVGEITLFDLLRESFRQNPDYLIVGEIRGKEAYVMFQSMASGHPSISTIHAGSVDDVIKRLQTRPISLSAGLLESLDIVIVMVHAREKGKSARRVKELVEIETIDRETGTPRISKAFIWIPSQDVFEYRGSSWLLNKISTEKGLELNNIIREIARRKKLIEWMTDKNMTSIKEIMKYIKLYYRNPKKVENIINKQA